MKNRTLARIIAFTVTVLMLFGAFAVFSAAEKKVAYDEEYCKVEYEDGVITVSLDAAKVGDILKNAKFNKTSLKELLPDDIYRVIDERSKSSVLNFLSNLAANRIVTYDEMLKIFEGNVKITNKYLNLKTIKQFAENGEITPMYMVTKLYGEGKLDDLLAIDGFRAALYEKTGADNDADAVTFYSELAEVVDQFDAYEQVPMRAIWNGVHFDEAVKSAYGSRANKALRAFVTNVLTGEIDELYCNGDLIYSDLLFDHNAIQAVVLKALPLPDKIAALGDGDTLMSFEFKSSGENVDMSLTINILVTGDTSTLNKFGNKFSGILTSFVVDDDGKVAQTYSFDDRFAQEYAQVLDCEEISVERKYELLSLYTADKEGLQAQFKGEKFEELLEDAKKAGIAHSDKIDAFKNKLAFGRNIMLKLASYEAEEYENKFTTIDAGYQGSGVFVLSYRDEIPMSDIAEKIRSRFASIDEVMEWVKQDDHVIDVTATFEIENFYRVRFFDSTNSLLYVTYLPVGYGLDLVEGAPDLEGHGENGWYDATGNQYDAMPDFDLDLYETVETTSLTITKVWEDDDNAAGARPDAITFDLFANNEFLFSFNLTENGLEITNEQIDEFVGRVMARLGIDINQIEGDTFEYTVTIPVENGDAAWAGTFTGLPLYWQGEQITYTVEENDVDDYQLTNVETTEEGYVFTNTYNPNVVDVTITKIWEDNDDQDGKRPESITVTLLADGEKVDEFVIFGLPVEVGEDTTEDDVPANSILAEVSEDGNTWTVKLEDLPKTNGQGVEIVYTVEEQAVAEYESNVQGCTITNVHNPEVITISGTKTWNDPKTKETKRPASIVIALYANGEEVARQEISGEGDVWAFTFENVYKYANGEEITYTVDEVGVEGYTKTIEGYDIVNTGMLEISLFALLGMAAIGGTVFAVKQFRKRRED